MVAFFTKLWEDFYNCFLDAGSYMTYLRGLRNTVIIALLACIFGLVIGVIITMIRIAPKNNPIMKALDALARLYVTIIRGTPVVLQLFICYFVLLAGIKSASFFGIKDTAGIWVAAVTFGVNSGAYMSEILRGGINAVPVGQTEAGRSLGLSWSKTFLSVVLPQAMKNAIPTIFNEFITLIKETSVAGYVGILDLTKVQKYITTQNMQMYMPLFIIAAIYLVLVLGLQSIQRQIEKKLSRGNRA